MTDPLIRLDGVSKSFTLPDGARFDAVRDLSLSVHAGEILGLIGKSGAGKSTLLRLINLLERPDAGRVHLNGRDLTALKPAELRRERQRLGMIFQQFNLLQNATAAQNVAFPLALHGGRSRREIADRAAECLALVGLADKADHYPAQLSGGQKQRVAIARALAPQPDVLLCDEPTSALDAETTRELLATLGDINARLGVTLVIVTHELEVVQTLCRRAAVIADGHLVEQFDVADAARAAVSPLGRALAPLQRQAALVSTLDAPADEPPDARPAPVARPPVEATAIGAGSDHGPDAARSPRNVDARQEAVNV
ncbi:MAG: methionine ABC transporter ATP-binding protein [Mitsuaria chitosanitabida]|uniref:methionine ABC transporter ATP-binding protein n=1 Tax=Roseateles chitosanitabidus TaxID=65048 RepID=UPI001AFF9AB9|nr:methionine ABC transporter ATP-binding protein [Roseateles chitosanitabidus]MBO9685474.1 methionine ABC transporter ATP-binding protein [Roseateles chitosanitabidus]